jgi:hypothetical protein
VKDPAILLMAKDWLTNVKLRRCSPAARGAWIDVICLMTQSDEYGVLRWPLRDIANAINVPLAVLRELAERRVIKGDDKNAEDYIYIPRKARQSLDPVMLLAAGHGSCWYCTRMLRDHWRRSRRGGSTRFSSEFLDNEEDDDHESAAVHSTGGSVNGSNRSLNHSPTARLSDGPTVAVAVAVADKPKPNVKSVTSSDLLPEVDPEVLSDWLTVRKAKRAPLTATAVKGMRRESERAGISIEDAVRVATERNWVAFNASWEWQSTYARLKGNAAAGHAGRNRQEELEARNRGIAARALEEHGHGRT